MSTTRAPRNDPRGLVYALWETALNCELPIESVNGEYDSGQFALTLRFADALKACDDAFLFGTMAREVAAGMGLLLSFLPKPIPDYCGSGLHVNFSLLDSTGDNATCRDGGLPASARQCVSGLIHHHESLAGFLATTVNGWHRLRWPATGRTGLATTDWSR